MVPQQDHQEIEMRHFEVAEAQGPFQDIMEAPEALKTTEAIPLEVQDIVEVPESTEAILPEEVLRDIEIQGIDPGAVATEAHLQEVPIAVLQYGQEAEEVAAVALGPEAALPEVLVEVVLYVLLPAAVLSDLPEEVVAADHQEVAEEDNNLIRTEKIIKKLSK